MSASAALAARWRNILVALGVVALLAFFLVAGKGNVISGPTASKIFAGEIAVTDLECGGGTLTITLTPDGIVSLVLAGFNVLGSPNDNQTEFDPPLPIAGDGTFSSSGPLPPPLETILFTFEGTFDFAPDPATVSGTLAIGLVADPGTVLCAATFTAEQLPSVEPTSTPTVTPCPQGKVPTVGGCGTPTATPDPAIGAMQVDCDASASGIQSDCTHAPGASFQVEVHVTLAPAGGYILFQAKLGWSKGVLNYLPTENPADEALWGPCTLAARINNWEATGEPSVFFSCNPFPSLNTGDTTTGAVLTFEMQCKSAPEALSPPAGLGSDQSVLQLVPFPDPQGGTRFADVAFRPIDPALTDATVTCFEPTPMPTPTPTKQPSPGDTDGDGCTDTQENGPNEALGGRRDYLSFWDFFDVPVGGLPRDGAVNSFDIGAVVLRFGTFVQTPPTKSEALAQALTPPADMTSYHAAYDRGGPIPGENLWNLRPPNGSIDAFDIGAMVIQFGHTCA